MTASLLDMSAWLFNRGICAYALSIEILSAGSYEPSAPDELLVLYCIWAKLFFKQYLHSYLVGQEA